MKNTVIRILILIVVLLTSCAPSPVIDTQQYFERGIVASPNDEPRGQIIYIGSISTRTDDGNIDKTAEFDVYFVIYEEQECMIVIPVYNRQSPTSSCPIKTDVPTSQ